MYSDSPASLPRLSLSMQSRAGLMAIFLVGSLCALAFAAPATRTSHPAMSNTLKQQIAADAVDGGVFLNTVEFAETIYHWPRGDEQCSAEVTAIVEWDDEAAQTGSGVDGEGNQLRSSKGERQLRYCKVEVPASLAIDDRDKFSIDGDVVNVIRVLGRDADLQTLRCVLPHPIRTREPRIRGGS